MGRGRAFVSRKCNKPGLAPLVHSKDYGTLCPKFVKHRQESMQLNDPRLYINRELSWLEFNQRVLDQAMDDTNPLLERVKFLCIVSSNLDEFFEIRVAGLKQQKQTGSSHAESDGLNATQQLPAGSKRGRQLVAAPK